MIMTIDNPFWKLIKDIIRYAHAREAIAKGGFPFTPSRFSPVANSEG